MPPWGVGLARGSQQTGMCPRRSPCHVTGARHGAGLRAPRHGGNDAATRRLSACQRLSSSPNFLGGSAELTQGCPIPEGNAPDTWCRSGRLIPEPKHPGEESQRQAAAARPALATSRQVLAGRKMSPAPN